MSKYVVMQPFIYMRDGAAVHHTRRDVGSEVELDDDQAKALVDVGCVNQVDVGDDVKFEVTEPAPKPRSRSRRVEEDGADV